MNPQDKSGGWVGWIGFASVMMMLLGIFQIIYGLVAILKQGFFVVTETSLLAFNFTTWGWITLLLGIIILAAGYELMRGALWARIMAVFLAGLSLVANMALMSAYPLWSIMIIVFDVFIIHALVVHGGELQDRR
jgi:hypothetical protein